jgi:hypothetical protein
MDWALVTRRSGVRFPRDGSDTGHGSVNEVRNPATVHCGRRVIGRVIKRLSSRATDDKDDRHRVSLSGLRLPRQTNHGSCKAVVRGSSPLAGSASSRAIPALSR